MLGEVNGKTVALWGLSFKPKTDDVREAPAQIIAAWLLKQGATVRAHDPEAMKNFKKEHPGVETAATPYDALKGADLLILVTEWDAFRNPDWERVKKLMRTPTVIDGRNIWLAYRDELQRLVPGSRREVTL